MAMTESANGWEREQLDRHMARIAGTALLVLGSLAVVGLLALLVICLLADPKGPPVLWLPPLQMGFLAAVGAALSCVVAIGGGQLRRGHGLALPVLMSWFLLAGLCLIVLVLVFLEKSRSDPTWRAGAAYAGAGLALVGAALALLILSSRANSRLRYGCYVAVSVAAAVGLLVVANVIAAGLSGRFNLRWNVESLGRYGLSDTAKRVLDKVNDKITLTTIYTSVKPDRRGEQYLPRVRDLLDEIRQYKHDVTVINVTSDRQKAEVQARLRQRLDEKAKDHRNRIKDFRDLVNTQRPQYEQLAAEWAHYPPSGWLTQFGVPKAFEEGFKANKAELDKAAAELRAELRDATLPDYSELTDRIKETLKRLLDRLDQIGQHLRQLQNLPATAGKSRPALTKAVAKLTAATNKVAELAGKPGTPPPDDPSAVLDKLARACTEAADAADAAGNELEKFNTATGKYAQFARSWRLEGISLPKHCTRLAGSLSQLAEQAQGIRAAAKVAVQRQFITRVRPIMPQLTGHVAKIQAGLSRLLEDLSKLDKHTQAIFERARKSDFLQQQSKPLNELLERIEKLKDLEDQKELIEHIDEDNILLVEVGEKIGVVGFEDVWPLEERQPWDVVGPEEGQERRIFNGDQAVRSKILSMASEPLGEVVLTYFEEPVPPFMRQYRRGMTGPIPSMYLQTLRQRLEKANLTVTEWNMAKEDDPPEPKAKGRPRVLLVLPPPEGPPMRPPGSEEEPNQWGEKQEKKLDELIAGGTGAVFLAAYFQPEMAQFGALRPVPYLLNDYLKKNWGVEARTDLRVVQAVPDPLNPGTYQLPVLRWTFLPLSAFTDHPAGKPLRARRLYWLSVCPVVKAEGKPKTTFREILVVPRNPSGGTWAASNPLQLERKLFLGQGRGIVPGSEADDMLPPFPVAAEAAKTVKGKTARIIVLGVGLSYVDPFINSPVPRLTGGETLATDPPPTSDVDLITNSVYYLIGKREFIGAGPSPTPRIRHIPPATMGAVKVVFGVLWPLALLAVGGVVMLLRKR